jgi:hypothetical protein
VEQAFRCLDLLLQGGGFGLVALDLADAPVRLVRKVPLNVWFRLRRAVENTSTILLVISQESNAKTCASLVLRAERESAQWSQQNVESAGNDHTPGCLLSGAVHTAEVVRSLLHYKRPVAIDQSRAGHCSDTRVHFQLHADPYAAQRCAAENIFLLPENEPQKERMPNPG